MRNETEIIQIIGAGNVFHGGSYDECTIMNISNREGKDTRCVIIDRSPEGSRFDCLLRFFTAIDSELTSFKNKLLWSSSMMVK